ncbi:MAG: hypothetical protein LQ340_008048, partial [Diploschistes diacapsis]
MPTNFPILLLDGGLGTTLTSPPYNITYDDTTPLWSSHLLISSPQTLASTHHAFASTGADIISTATYQASTSSFARTPRTKTTSTSALAPCSPDSNAPGDGYSPSEAATLMRSAIPLALSSRFHQPPHLCPKPQLALTLGPHGATLPSSADYIGVPAYPVSMQSSAALEAWHAARLAIFASDAPAWDAIDYVAFETIR